MTYDKIKSHKKLGLHPFSGKHIFGRLRGERWGGVRDQTDAPPFLEGYGRGRGSD